VAVARREKPHIDRRALPDFLRVSMPDGERSQQLSDDDQPNGMTNSCPVSSRKVGEGHTSQILVQVCAREPRPADDDGKTLDAYPVIS